MASDPCPTAVPSGPAASRPGQGGLVWRPAPPGSAAAEAGDWPPVLIADDLLERGVVAAFTSRAGGSSPPPYDSLNLGLRIGDEPRRVLANRRRVLTVLGLAGRPIACLRQVHGDRVVPARLAGLGPGPPEGKAPMAEADGLVVTAADPEPVLMVLAADCVPVLLADPEARVGAAVHAGWRGTAAGVVEAGVAALAAAGGDPARTIALIGPCIGPAAYEVGPDVRDQVAARYPVAAAETRAGTQALDLAAAADAALRAAGVAEIRAANASTAHEPDRWFSYRRDGTTGRQAGLLALVAS
jgi:YfiH family protein